MTECWKCGDTGTWINLQGKEAQCDECTISTFKDVKEAFERFRQAAKKLWDLVHCPDCDDTGLIHYGLPCHCVEGQKLSTIAGAVSGYSLADPFQQIEGLKRARRCHL